MYRRDIATDSGVALEIVGRHGEGVRFMARAADEGGVLRLKDAFGGYYPQSLVVDMTDLAQDPARIIAADPHGQAREFRLRMHHERPLATELAEETPWNVLGLVGTLYRLPAGMTAVLQLIVWPAPHTWGDELEARLEAVRRREHAAGYGGDTVEPFLYAVLRWIEAERAEGRMVDEAGARLRLAQIWAEQGPLDQAFEAIYRRNAEEMVARALRHSPRSRDPVELPTWEVALPHGRVRLRPDHVEVQEDGTELYQRLRTGRISRSEKDKDIYALYQVGATQARSGARKELQIVSLSTGTVETVSLSQQALNARLERYDAAIVGILEGDFPPQPSERECPRCPHYFICPLAEDTLMPPDRQRGFPVSPRRCD